MVYIFQEKLCLDRKGNSEFSRRDSASKLLRSHCPKAGWPRQRSAVPLEPSTGIF